MIRFAKLLFLASLLFSAYSLAPPVAASMPDTAAAEPPARIAILGAMPPLTTGEEAAALERLLKRQGHDVLVISPAQLSDVGFLNPARFQLLIVPHCDVFPAQSEANLVRYLKSAGRLLCLGGPAFSRAVYTNGAAWMSRHEILNTLQAHDMTQISQLEPQRWARASSDPASDASLQQVDSPYGKSLEIAFNAFKDWDNFSTPNMPKTPFAIGDTLTSFMAKGDANTRAAVIEWDETDGSRWIAAAPLTTAWRKVTLEPADFHFWNDGTAKGRGGPADRFHPDQAAELRIGLAQSHAPMAAGAHRLWIAGISSAAMPAPFPSPGVGELVLEGLAPMHKQVHDTVSGLWLPVLRDRGIGLAGPRTGRLLPADLSAPAFPTSSAGYEQWVRIALSGPFTGAIWGGDAQPARPGTTPDPMASVNQILQNVFLTSGGADRAAVMQREPIEVGAEAINLGRGPALVHVSEELQPIPMTQGSALLKAESDVSLPRGARTRIGSLGRQTALAPGVWRYKIVLTAGKDGQILDRIEIPLRVVPAAAPAPADQRVHVEGAEFVLNGRPFRPVGINYWPLNVAGQEPSEYQRGWLSPEQYDPDLIEQDLVRCERIGANLVSVQYQRPDQGPALMDFMARCRNHHILVNVFVADADPRYLNVKALETLLDAAHLSMNADLFAFDVAWEPHLGRHADRVRCDEDWRRWVDLNYGSVENAEADWKFKAPRSDKDGGMSNPDDGQLSADGPWRVMTAAYRRFADEMLSHGYRSVRAALAGRGALIGARSGYGGNGYPGVDDQMPFDLLSGAAHMDFISPEGYGLNGDWPEFRAGGFTAVYARWAGAGKPVFWAEFGSSVYPNTDAERLSIQADQAEKMYRLIVDSGSNGSSAWWFSGGIRLDENSDYGIFNSDGTARLAAAALNKSVAALSASPVGSKPDAVLTGDRDADARGYSALSMKLKQQYAELRAAGKFPEYRTPGTGATTADMPLVAVGEDPANGHNPLKYAVGEVYVDPAKPDSVALLNTGDTAWTTSGPGRVILTVTTAAGAVKLVPLPAGTVPRYGSCRMSLAVIRSSGGAGRLKLRLAVAERPDSAVRLLPFGEETVIDERD